MKKIIITASVTLSVMLFSCSKEERFVKPDIYSSSSSEIIVNPIIGDGAWEPISKAASDLAAREVDDSYLQNNGFGLFAYYTGKDAYVSINDAYVYDDSTDPVTEYGTVRGLVFNNRKFLWDGGSSSWKHYQYYGGVDHEGKSEFWPTNASDNLTFFAYAPWNAWHEKVSTSASYDSPYIKYDDYVASDLTPASLEKQQDLLWGTNEFGMAHKDVGMSDYDPEGVVDMHFRHAPAKVSFAVRGSFSGVEEPAITGGVTTEAYTSSESIEYGEWEENTETIYYVYHTSGGGSNYYCVRRETTIRRQIQTKTRNVRRITTNAKISRSGDRYLVNNASIRGFREKGTLVLDNASAYEPSWTDISGTINYSLDKSPDDITNVLTQSLRNPGATTLKDNANIYKGISESATDMMGGYYLYVIPLDAGSINVDLNYSRYQISSFTIGTLHRDFTRTWIDEAKTTTIRELRSSGKNKSNATSAQLDPSKWTWGSSWKNSDDSYLHNNTTRLDYGTANDVKLGTSTITPTFSAAETDPDTPAIIDSEVSDPAEENKAELKSNTSTTGSIASSFLGGRAYTINLIVAGKKLDLTVVPRPWNLEEMMYDYTADINDVIQALTYDSAFIDYADVAGNVYINNRMGKFYFKLGEGKYKAWQASLVGDAAFGFTDENGNWLTEADGVTKVSSIRAAVDENVMNYIYVKALDTESTTTNRAKLRIYYFDSDGEATAALNLVNMDGVVEWTIVQNAN